MLTATDSFIDYLQTGLAGSPVVHWVHVDPNDPASNVLQQDALNVTILSGVRDRSIEKALISLDLLGSDERQVMTWLASVLSLLSETQVISEMRYDVTPLTPTPVAGKAVSWDGLNIRFMAIPADAHYLHLNSTFPISHAAL
jgi:hypothetical protein